MEYPLPDEKLKFLAEMLTVNKLVSGLSDQLEKYSGIVENIKTENQNQNRGREQHQNKLTLSAQTKVNGLVIPFTEQVRTVVVSLLTSLLVTSTSVIRIR